MLDRVEVTNTQGKTLILPLYDAVEGYSVQDIEGLDPVEANLVTSSFALMDGEQYHSSRRVSRNITLKLGLDPSYAASSVQDLRTTLYGYFMPKTEVRLRFYLDGQEPKDIYGRVEDFNSPRFVKNPQATISLLCVKPDFYIPEPVVIQGRTVADMTDTIIEYPGTVETGIVFTLMPNRAVSQFTINQVTPEQGLVALDFVTDIRVVGATLNAGDILTISTVTGNKYVRHVRAGTERSYLYAVTPSSNWINLYPGQNALRVVANGVGVPYNIEYTTKFGGI